MYSVVNDAYNYMPLQRIALNCLQIGNNKGTKMVCLNYKVNHFSMHIKNNTLHTGIFYSMFVSCIHVSDIYQCSEHFVMTMHLFPQRSEARLGLHSSYSGGNGNMQRGGHPSVLRQKTGQERFLWKI